jgi:hypothetical protein
MDDTPPHILKILIDGYRKMSPRQKLKRVDELTKSVQELAMAGIRARHGDIPQQEMRLRLGALWLDREIMVRVFNWDPQKEGY